MWRPRVWLWLAVLLLLLWVLQTVSLRQVWQVLGGLSLWQILVLILANGLVLITMSGRWWLILRAQGHPVPYFTLAGYRLAAFGVSYFTPGPQFGGEPLQVYLVRGHHRVPGSLAVAGVTLDKLLELLVNFSFLVGGLIFVVQQQIFSGPVGLLMAGVGLGMLGGTAVGPGGAQPRWGAFLPDTPACRPDYSEEIAAAGVYVSVAGYQRVAGVIRAVSDRPRTFAGSIPARCGWLRWCRW